MTRGPPVFVVGMPRSGTTLLAEILDAHPDLVVAPETRYFLRFWVRCDRTGCLEDPERLRAHVDRFISSEAVAEMGFEESDRRELVRAILEAGTVDHRTILGTVLDTYADRRDAVRWGEKTPAHIQRLPVIRETFPEAVIVGIVRDPRDVSLSLQGVPWNEGSPLDHALRWRDSIRRLDADRGRRPHRGAVVRYEDLLQDTEAVVREICDAADLPFDPSMLAFHTSETGTFDADREPWKAKAAGPIDPTNVEKWRDRMDPSTRSVIEAVAGTEMSDHGYPASAPSWTVPAVARFAWWGIGHAVGRMGHRIRQLRDAIQARVSPI